MTANERRRELMRILISRRRETMGELASELGVTDRTIRRDISILTAEHPLDAVRGNGGCVKVADWYQPHKNILSGEQQRVLIQLLHKSDETQKKVLREMLAAFGTQAVRDEYTKEVMWQ